VSWVRSSALIAGVTLLTKVTGFLRVTAITGRLGATAATDAFLTAFLVPESIYVFLTEGAITAAFVPPFTRARAEGEGSFADLLAGAAGRVFALSGIAAVLVWVFAREITGLIAPGFPTETCEQAASLLALVAFYIPLAATAAVLFGALNARDHFLMPALGPLAFNVAMIAAVGFARPESVRALAYGVLAGGALQLALQMAVLVRAGPYRLRAVVERHHGLAEILALLVPLTFSLGVTQVQILAERVLASGLPAGVITSMNLVQKLVNLPLGLVGMAVAAPLLPALARARLAGDAPAFARSLARGLVAVVALITPLAVACLVASGPIVRVLFQRGAFGADRAADAATMLWHYAFGLPAVSVAYLLTGAFLAAGDAMGPALVRAGWLTANVALNYAWLSWMGVAGIPLAWSLMWMGTAAVLFAIALRRFAGLGQALTDMTIPRMRRA
jgi:putative peptidoglycan lipid II flippase